jgi:hypothetical protein
MPLAPGEDVGTAISELHGGKTYSRTKKKFGKKRAQKQSIAIAMHNKRRRKKKQHHRQASRRMTHR